VDLGPLPVTLLWLDLNDVAFDGTCVIPWVREKTGDDCPKGAYIAYGSRQDERPTEAETQRSVASKGREGSRPFEATERCVSASVGRSSWRDPYAR
jgi:hypothetical protein